MDTNAYLKRHGWRGDGHSLDTTDRGIRRPLLVSKKVDMLGVGLNKHAAVSDQWWMRAFDEGLKNLGSGTKSTLANVREKGVHFGGLYGRFVKGETVEGTIESEEDEGKKTEGSATVGSKRKRSSNDDDDGGGKHPKRRPEDTETTTGAKLAKRLEGQTKAVAREAVERGLIAKGSKGDGKKSSKTSAKVDEATLLHIFELASLKELRGLAEGSSKSARKQAKLNREKPQRELKRIARAHFTSQLSSTDRALVKQAAEAEEAHRSSKGELRQVEKYNIAAQKTIARASASAKRSKRLEEKQAGASRISVEKAAQYAKRAAEKGMTVEEYIRRRGEKSSAKKSQNSSSEASVDFVVDTTGDPALKTQAMLLSTTATTTSGVDVLDKEGAIRYTITPGTPVPLDPTIWNGLDVKSLPKPVRRARKEWMAAKSKVPE